MAVIANSYMQMKRCRSVIFPPRASSVLVTMALLLAITACSPTVQVAPPTEPIEINLNVKIEHDLRVRLDKEVADVIATEDSLF